MSLFGKYFALSQASRRFAQGCVSLPRAIKNRNMVRSYWGFGNFGDLITPYILKEMGYTPVNSPRVSFGEFVFVGSILDSIRDSFDGVIFGSGFLTCRRPKNLSHANILALRGQYSRKLCGLDRNIPLGDGGLLFPYFFNNRPGKKYRLGIVPHYSDQNREVLKMWGDRFGNQCKIISPLQSPEVVFEEISSCDYLVSSSLHGLVFADALGIPNLWIELSDHLGNGDFKFHDYYSAFDIVRAQFIPDGTEDIESLVSRMNVIGPDGHSRIEDLYSAFLPISKIFQKPS